MKRGWIWFTGIAIVLAVLLALPFLVPLDRFIPEIEAVATEKIGVPLKIGSLRLFLLPAPHVTATAIEVGSREIEVGKVLAYPELGTLFSAPRVIRVLEIDGLAVRDTLFARLKLPKDTGPKAVEIRRVTVKDLRPTVQGKPLGSWNADVTLGGAIGVERAEVRSGDGKFAVRLAPEKNHWNLSITGKDWQPPLGPPLHFTSLDASGRLTEKSLDLPVIQAALYGGKLAASLKVEFPARWQIGGNFSGENIDIAPLARVFVPKQALGGRLRAEGRFSSRAAKPEALADALRLDGRFSVTKGVLYGFDFATAATSLLKGGTQGGETRFDEFSGSYQIAGRNVQLRNVVISSGVLAARGKVDITGATQHLSGSMDVELKHTRGLVGVPVAFSGTIKDPTLRPTKGAAIGAAVGTVILPGVGTSIGAGAGRFFEKKTEK